MSGLEQVDLERFKETPVDADRGVRHPLIRSGAIEKRDYQLDIARTAIVNRTLVVLPTGLGKTIVAVLAAADVLNEGPGKVLMLAPTRPLVNQHADTFDEFLLVDKQVDLAGKGPKRRASLFDEARVVFSTPQGLLNDVEADRVNLADVGLLIVDEAHRTVGDYAYVGMAQAYRDARPEGGVLGLTASPGGDRERVEEVTEHLDIEAIEARTRLSPDVAPYVFDTRVDWRTVQLPDEMDELRETFQAIAEERADKLRSTNFLPPKPYLGRKDLVACGNKIKAAIPKAGNKGPLFGLLLNQGVAMQALHCSEVVETQGVEPLVDYLDRTLADPDTKSAKSFANDERVQQAFEQAKAWKGSSHPKVPELVDVLENGLADDGDSLVLVFAKYRDTIAAILRALDEAGIEARKFVGQGDRENDPGMSQDEQRAVLERFANREFRVLVATSVAEEGLDIPDVDLVVFYEPVPSEVRRIQRRGRTGRHGVGRAMMLVTEDTRDEAFLHAGRKREEKMRWLVEQFDEG